MNPPQAYMCFLIVLTESSLFKNRATILPSLLRRMGFPGGSDGKESACNSEDAGSIPGSGRSPGEGNGNPLQYFCLENPMDRETWQAIVHGVAKESVTTEHAHMAKYKILFGLSIIE